MTKVKDIYNYIDSIAPFDTQEEWDNSGLLAGDFHSEVKSVVMSLDATKEAVSFARSVNSDLLLTHHPAIFSGLKSVPCGTAVYELISGGVSLICAHTNFDKAPGGIGFGLSSLLKLKNVEQKENGYVFTGDLDGEMSIDDVAEYVEEALDCHGIRYTDTDKMIKKIAVVGGSGGDFIEFAENCSDCLVTGDLKYHEMLDAREADYPVISAGHYETESLPFLMLKEKLEKEFPGVKFIIAPVSNPVLSV